MVRRVAKVPQNYCKTPPELDIVSLWIMTPTGQSGIFDSPDQQEGSIYSDQVFDDVIRAAWRGIRSEGNGRQPLRSRGSRCGSRTPRMQDTTASTTTRSVTPSPPDLRCRTEPAYRGDVATISIDSPPHTRTLSFLSHASITHTYGHMLSVVPDQRPYPSLVHLWPEAAV